MCCASPPLILITVRELFTRSSGTFWVIPASPDTTTWRVVVSPRWRFNLGAERLMRMLRNGHCVATPFSLQSIFVGPTTSLVFSTTKLLGDSATGGRIVGPTFT